MQNMRDDLRTAYRWQGHEDGPFWIVQSPQGGVTVVAANNPPQGVVLIEPVPFDYANDAFEFVEHRARRHARRKQALHLIVLIVIGLVLFASMQDANADCPYSCRLSWQFPTEYTDGTPLDPTSELSYADLWCDEGAGFNSIARINVPQNSFQFSRVMPPGNYACYVTVTDTALNESGASNTVPFVHEVAPPSNAILGVQ